jgi:hypothetical protein
MTTTQPQARPLRRHREAALSADYNDTPQSNQVLALTGQAEFTKYFLDPTE